MEKPAPMWWLMEQDEDLMFGRHHFVSMLVEAQAGCPKADYVVTIVEHWVRDVAHHHLWEGHEKLREALHEATRLLPHLPTQAHSTRKYFERLTSYLQPAKVNQQDAIQRVLDLRRCHANPHQAPEVSREGKHWVAPLQQANLNPGRIVIEVATGRMSGTPRGGIESSSA